MISLQVNRIMSVASRAITACCLLPFVPVSTQTATAQTVDVGSNAVGPDVRQLSDVDELARRLIDPDADRGGGDVMSQLIKLMEDSETRMHREFDIGPGAQAQQDEILQKMDTAIQMALRQRKRVSGVSEQDADPRTMPPTGGQRKPAETESASGRQSRQPHAAGIVEDDNDRDRTQGPIDESRRGWGHLPSRDRDEILQGINEQALEGYRDLIDDYFRTLAQPPNEHQRK